MKKLVPLLVVSAALLVISPALLAHHGVAEYEINKTITLSGRITGFDWTNPHCLIHLDVTDDKGNPQHWTLELAATPSMARHGWTRNSLKVGDQVQVETHPAKNGAPLGLSGTTDSIKSIIVNGKPLPT